MAMLYAVLCAFFCGPALAAANLSLAEKTVQTVTAFQKAESMREWIDTAPGLSPYERAALREDPRLRDEELPQVSVRTAGSINVYVKINGEEFDFSYIRQGKLLYRGRTITVKKGMFLHDVAEAVAQAMNAKSGQKKLSFSNLLWPQAALATGSLARGCTQKNYFSLPVILDSPLGYAPPLWISSIAISLVRKGVDAFRDCKAQTEDLRRLLTENKLAIKSMNCGEDEWGSDRNMEFWTNTKKDGEYQTRKFNLDYVNYFAEELKDDDTSERLYIFGETFLKEVRTVGPGENGFNGKCQVLNHQSSGKEAKEFAAHREKIEAYRKIFYYIGENSSCTACPEIENSIISPTPPPYLTGKKPAPAAANPAPKGKKADSSSAQ